MLKVYGASWCKFCKKAKDLLESTNTSFEFVDIDEKVDESFILIEKGLETIPQIFDGDTIIGGYSELVEQINAIP